MDRYAVIGNPVAHSLSPRIHAAFAEATGEALVYETLLAPLDGFARTAEAFFEAGGAGLNITVPFKRDAADWVAEMTPAARAARAVNTVFRSGEGWCGDNTDGQGLLRDLEGNCREPLRGRRILLLGAGGAARGALRPLLAAEPAQLVIANRTPGRAESLMNEAATDDVGVVLAAMGLEAVRGPFDLVINATSAGLDGRSVARGLGEETLAGAFCYDMIYAPGSHPAATAFCRWARHCGARRTADGLGMLVEQAALAFLAWRGVSPATAPVLELLRPVSV